MDSYKSHKHKVDVTIDPVSNHNHNGYVDNHEFDNFSYFSTTMNSNKHNYISEISNNYDSFGNQKISYGFSTMWKWNTDINHNHGLHLDDAGGHNHNITVKSDDSGSNHGNETRPLNHSLLVCIKY